MSRVRPQQVGPAIAILIVPLTGATGKRLCALRVVLTGIRFIKPDRYRVRVFANGVDIGGTYFTVGMQSRLN